MAEVCPNHGIFQGERGQPCPACWNERANRWTPPKPGLSPTVRSAVEASRLRVEAWAAQLKAMTDAELEAAVDNLLNEGAYLRIASHADPAFMPRAQRIEMIRAEQAFRLGDRLPTPTFLYPEPM